MCTEKTHTQGSAQAARLSKSLFLPTAALHKQPDLPSPCSFLLLLFALPLALPLVSVFVVGSRLGIRVVVGVVRTVPVGMQVRLVHVATA